MTRIKKADTSAAVDQPNAGSTVERAPGRLGLAQSVAAASLLQSERRAKAARGTGTPAPTDSAGPGQPAAPLRGRDWLRQTLSESWS